MPEPEKTATAPPPAAVDVVPQEETGLAWWKPKNLLEAKNLAEWLGRNTAQSVPKVYRDKPGDALVAIMRGAELGLSPAASLQLLWVIHGKTGMDATLIRARAMAHPDCIRFHITEATAERSTVEVLRRSPEFGQPPSRATVTVTIDDARRAKWGMTTWVEQNGKRVQIEPHWEPDSSWVKTPDDMLVARATAKAARRYFPEVFAGVYELGELADFRHQGGEVLDVPAGGQEIPLEQPVVPQPGEATAEALARGLAQERAAAGDVEGELGPEGVPSAGSAPAPEPLPASTPPAPPPSEGAMPSEEDRLFRREINDALDRARAGHTPKKGQTLLEAARRLFANWLVTDPRLLEARPGGFTKLEEIPKELRTHCIENAFRIGETSR